MLPRTYVPRYLCSPVPMFSRTYVPRYLCSSVPVFAEPMFPGTYRCMFAESMFRGAYIIRYLFPLVHLFSRAFVPRYLCSPVPMFPGTHSPNQCFPIPMSPVPIFPDTRVPRCLCSPIPTLPGSQVTVVFTSIVIISIICSASARIAFLFGCWVGYGHGLKLWLCLGYA